MQFAKIKFVHNLINGPKLSIWLDQAPLISKVDYKDISPYICIAPGEHKIQIFEEGEMKTPMLVYDLKFENQDYTLVLTGDTPDNWHLSIYEDLLQAPEKTVIRFIHGSKDFPNIDIYNNNIKIFTDLAYDMATQYAVVDDISLAITAKDSLDAILGPITIKLMPREIYTFLIIGKQLKISNDTATMCLTL